jgi:hypothetical protein
MHCDTDKKSSHILVGKWALLVLNMKQNNINYNRKYGENKKSHIYQFKNFIPLKSLM